MTSKPKLLRWQNWMLGVGAIAFGLVGVAGTRSFIDQSLQSERARLADNQRTVATVVAKSKLPVGSVISVSNMAVRQMPEKYLPPTAIRAEGFDEVKGLQLRASMVAGQALVKSIVGSPVPGFSDRVGHGVRAMTIVVDEVNSVSGMLTPGDRIDLLFSTRPPRRDGQPGTEVTTPLMQDLLILATGQRADKRDHAIPVGRTPGAFTSITVAVTPDQAQRLVLAQRSGRLTALLRNPTDRREQRAAPMDVYKLLGIARPDTAQKTNRRAPQIIVGGLGSLSLQQGNETVMDDAKPPVLSDTTTGERGNENH